jgi:hypothetical protein
MIRYGAQRACQQGLGASGLAWSRTQVQSINQSITCLHNSALYIYPKFNAQQYCGKFVAGKFVVRTRLQQLSLVQFQISLYLSDTKLRYITPLCL